MNDKRKSDKIFRGIERRGAKDNYFGEMYLGPRAVDAADSLKRIKKGTKGSNNNNN